MARLFGSLLILAGSYVLSLLRPLDLPLSIYFSFLVWILSLGVDGICHLTLI